MRVSYNSLRWAWLNRVSGIVHLFLPGAYGSGRLGWVLCRGSTLVETYSSRIPAEHRVCPICAKALEELKAVGGHADIVVSSNKVKGQGRTCTVTPIGASGKNGGD